MVCYPGYQAWSEGLVGRNGPCALVHMCVHVSVGTCVQAHVCVHLPHNRQPRGSDEPLMLCNPHGVDRGHRQGRQEDR